MCHPGWYGAVAAARIIDGNMPGLSNFLRGTKIDMPPPR